MLRTDLKIFKSERMTQQADAGGQRTGNEVQNGQLNEMFGNISDIDHAQSAVDIVKVYPAVFTNDTQLLKKGHQLINEPPIDPLVDVMLVQSSAINDGSERADIIEAIESSLVASIVLRSGLSEMVAGQDQLSAIDLTSATVAPSGEQPSVSLRVGGIYCLAVEYTGTESTDWPRFQHFIKVTEVNSEYIRFEPPVPYPAPGRTRVVNGQQSCTKIRDTTAGEGVVYHGVTQLTDAASGTTLQVTRTAGRVTPLITEAVARENNQPYPSQDGLVKKLVQTPAIGVAYTVAVADYSALPGTYDGFQISYVNNGAELKQSVRAEALAGGNLSFVLNRMPDSGTVVSISYYSNSRYLAYDNTDALPVGYSLKLRTISGSVRNASGSRFSVIVDDNDDTRLLVRYFDGIANREFQVAVINPADGTPTYYNSFDDLQYVAVIELDSASGESALSAAFVMPFDSVLPATFYVSVERVSGGLTTGSADSAGDVTGSGVSGTLVGGVVELSFSQAVKLSTLRYNVDEVVQLIPPQSLYGINPLRLPNGGAVELFRPFGTICVSHNQYEDLPTLTPAQTIARRPNAFIDIVDAEGASLWHPLDQHYEYDKVTGEVTIVSAAGFTAPFELIDTLSELALVTAVEQNQLKITKALVGSYPAGSVVSSVSIMGDMQARVTNVFDQNVWYGDFLDLLQNDPATASYNNVDYPIEVVNNSATNERWAIHFVSETAFRVVGENVGQVGTGDIMNDFAAINPNTGSPYFVIRASGWGGGWQPGNVLRFNTVAASKPAVLLRSVSAGHSNIEQDSIRLHFRGNAA